MITTRENEILIKSAGVSVLLQITWKGNCMWWMNGRPMEELPSVGETALKFGFLFDGCGLEAEAERNPELVCNCHDKEWRIDTQALVRAIRESRKPSGKSSWADLLFLHRVGRFDPRQWNWFVHIDSVYRKGGGFDKWATIYVMGSGCGDVRGRYQLYDGNEEGLEMCRELIRKEFGVYDILTGIG